MEALEEDYEDGNRKNESRQFIEGVMDLQQRINRLETMTKKLKIAKFGPY